MYHINELKCCVLRIYAPLKVNRSSLDYQQANGFLNRRSEVQILSGTPKPAGEDKRENLCRYPESKADACLGGVRFRR